MSSERNLNEILTEINGDIQAGLSYGANSEFHALGQIFPRGEKSRPIKNINHTEGSVISLQDVKNFVLYHRIDSDDILSDASLGKGNKPYRQRQYSMVMIGFGEAKNMSLEENREHSNEVAMDVIKLVPTVTDSNEIIEFGSINTDKVDILNTEFEGYDLNRSLIDYVIFTVEYTITLNVC